MSLANKKIVFLAPFGIRPKGTLHARMFPLARELAISGKEITVVAPPYTNPEDSGKVEFFEGIKLVNVQLPAKLTPLSAYLVGWRMLKAATAEYPELIHLFKPKGYGGLAIMLGVFCQLSGKKLPPVFVDTDDWEGVGGMNDLQPYSKMEKKFFHFQENWLPRKAVGVTVASRTLQTQVWGMGIPRERTLYLPNGQISTPCSDRLLARSELGFHPGDAVVLLYTRFFEFQQERLHQVFKEIAEKCPRVKFLVVGQGRNDEGPMLEKASVTMGFSENLRLAGWLNPEQIPAYLAAADVAIYPLDDNLINRAKCPAKLTEIMAAGCPIVADRVGQAAEYIRSGESGLLVDPEVPQCMVDAVVKLLNDDNTRQKMGQVAASDIVERFNWSDLALHLSDFYRACLETA